MKNSSKVIVYSFEVLMLIMILVAVTITTVDNNWVRGPLLLLQWLATMVVPFGLFALCVFHCREVRRLPSRLAAMWYVLGAILVFISISLCHFLLATILESPGLAEYTREELAKPYRWMKFPALAIVLVPVFVVLMYRAIRGPWGERVPTSDDEVAAKLGEMCAKLIPDWPQRLSTRVSRLILDGNTTAATKLYREERDVSWDEARHVVERWKHRPWLPALNELSSFTRETSQPVS